MIDSLEASTYGLMRETCEEAAAAEAINANHMHHACSLNYAMPRECLIHFTKLVSIQKEYSTDMLIGILREF